MKIIFKKLNLAQSIKILMGLLCLAILGGGGIYGYYNSQIQNLQQELDQLNLEFTHLKSQPIPEIGPSFQDKISSLADLDMMVDDLTKPININILELVKAEYDSEEIDIGVMEKKVKLTLKGSFSDIGIYIENIENFLLPFRIKQFLIESINNDTGLVSATIEGSFFGIK